MSETRIILCPNCGHLKDTIIDNNEDKFCPYCNTKTRVTDLTPNNFYNMTSTEKSNYIISESTRKLNGQKYDGTAWSKRADIERQRSSSQPQIKCPTCSSTNVSRISTTAKVANIAMFGLLGQKRKHQFKCNSCRYEW